MDKELKEILDKYSGKEHYGYEDAKKDLLNLFNASGCFSSGESEDLEDAMKIFEKEEGRKVDWTRPLDEMMIAGMQAAISHIRNNH